MPDKFNTLARVQEGAWELVLRQFGVDGPFDLFIGGAKAWFVLRPVGQTKSG